MSPAHLGRHDSWDGVRAVVAGFGVSGFAAADNLTHLGAAVTALDESAEGHQKAEKAELLEVLGARIVLGPGSTATLPDDVDVVVTSPGWKPGSPLLEQARARGVPVWGEVELAWRLRDPNHDTPWLVVTGTNGKTTTTQMLDAILRAEGLRSQAVGNVGLPIVEAVMDPLPYDVLAVELSSFQLHYTDSMSAQAAAVLNLAEDHLDWYASMAEYAADKARAYERVQRACVYNVEDPATERLVREADVVEGARAVGFTLGMPAVGMVGLVEDILADRAFVDERATSAAEPARWPTWPTRGGRRRRTPCRTPWPRRPWPARTASARPRSATDCEASGRAATASPWSPSTTASRGWTTRRRPTRTPPWSSLLAYDPVVWVAGGLAKGATFDDLVRGVRDRLRGVVLLGRDRDLVAQALARHAPDVRVIDVGAGETAVTVGAGDHQGDSRSVMGRVVAAAAELARPGTRCCWHPDVPRWTCSPTTPPAGTRSPRRCRSTPDSRRGGTARRERR